MTAKAEQRKYVEVADNCEENKGNCRPIDLRMTGNFTFCNTLHFRPVSIQPWPLFLVAASTGFSAALMTISSSSSFGSASRRSPSEDVAKSGVSFHHRLWRNPL